jgi:hypothetical protein
MLRTIPNAPVAESEKRRKACWKREEGRIVRIVSEGRIIAVKMIRVSREGCRIMARAMAKVDLEQ